MAPQMDPRPTLVLNPPGDERFRRLALGAMKDDAITPAQLETELRRAYPRAAVRPRELAGEQAEIWYVYRDGHWVRSDSSGSRVPDAAREDHEDEGPTVVDGSGERRAGPAGDVGFDPL
jgi:hypothetical protein